MRNIWLKSMMLCAFVLLAGRSFAAASNDDFANAQTLSGSSGSVLGTLTGATLETNEPNHGNAGALKSVWFNFTMPQNGTLKLTVTTNGNSSFVVFPIKAVAVYAGSAVSGLTLQGQISNISPSTYYSVSTTLEATHLTSGTQYQIAIASTNTAGFTLNYSVLTPPTNDDFANAIALSGASGSVSGTNVNATSETGEPTGQRTVWYSLTVPSTGDVEFRTSTYGMQLDAYTGSAITALTPVASVGVGSSDLKLLTVAAATVLYVRASGVISFKGGPVTQSAFTLNYNVYPVPANDNFANATVLNDTGDSVSDSNFSSSVETGEPPHSGSAAASFRTVWYKWTVPAKSNIKIYVTSDEFNTELGVYTGSSVGALTAVAKSDDLGTITDNTNNTTDSGVSMSSVAAGTVLMIAVGSTSQAGIGNFDLETEYAEIGTSNPANDDFAKAEVVTFTDNGDGTFSGSTSGDNTGAGSESGEPAHSLITSSAYTSVWYKITMPVAGGVSFGQDSDNLRMAAYVGSAVGSLTNLGHGAGSLILNSVAKDTVIYLAVDGRTLLDSDSFSLTVDVGAAPKNDNFANAEVLKGQAGSVDGTALYATTEAGDPTHNAVWYTWTLPASGVAIIDCEQPFKVFTGTQLTALNPVYLEPNDNYIGSTFGQILSAVSGTTVKIAVYPSASAISNGTFDFTLSYDIQSIPAMDSPGTVLGEVNITDFGATGVVADNNGNYGVYRADPSVLPPGVSFDPKGIVLGAGAFYGIPTQAGEFAVTVTGITSYTDYTTNPNGNTLPSKIILDSKVITFKIYGAPAISGNLTALGFVDTPFAYTLQINGFPAPTVSATGLPPGLTFNGISILGTPTTEGVYSVAISAVNQFATSNQTVVITVESSRNIDAFAGDGYKDPYGRFQGDGGAAIEASLNEPVGLAIDSAGNVFIADVGNNRIRRVSIVTGTITTIAGGTVRGFGGDNGLAADASLDYPAGIAFDSAGNLYIADTNNHRVRKIDTAGVITSVVGAGSTFTDRGEFGGDGGAAVQAKLNFPSGVVVDANNKLYISDAENGRIRRVDLGTGVITTYAGNGSSKSAGADGVPATDCRLGLPTGICLDSAGNLYVADTGLHVVRKIDATTGKINRVAGTGTPGYNGDGQNATAAQLYAPTGVAIDRDGNLLITDSGNNSLRRVNLTTGIIATIVGRPSPLPLKKGMTFTEVVSILSLSTSSGGDGGASTNANLSAPMGVAFNVASNTLFVSDTGNQKVRAVGLSFNPNPSTVGQPNIDQGKPAVVNPLSGVTIDIVKSDGGAVELSLSIAQVAGSKSRISDGEVDFFTDFDSAIPGRSGRVGSRRGSHPAITFTQAGIYRATVIAQKKSDGSLVGNGRKMIVVTNRETGQASEAQDSSSRSSAISKIAASGKFTFSDNGAANAKLDTVKFTGSIVLPPKFDLSKAHEIDVGIGNVVDTLRIDKSGKPIFLNGSLKAVNKFAIKLPKVAKGKSALAVGTEVVSITFTMALKDLDVAGFDSDGIAADVHDLGTNKSLTRKIQVSLLLGGVGYSSTQFNVTFTPSKVDANTNTAEGGSFTGKSTN